MKIRTFATFSALLLLSLAAPRLTSAQTASGTYKFVVEGSYTKYVEFDARTQADGTAIGTMFFSDEAEIANQDVDGTGDPNLRQSYSGYTMSVDVDGLTVSGNQAVISGTVRDSTIRDVIGQRVLLTVEDNGDNTREPDKVTWGLYNPVKRDWDTSDAELREDPGVGMTWTATDAEVREDQGIQMPRDESITTDSFPVSSYSFADVTVSSGDIQVAQR
jgi:hypothetical protein